MVGLQTVINPTYALQLPNSATGGVGQAQANAWITYSDARVKSDQHPVSYGLKEVLALQPKQYLHHSTLNYASSLDHDPGTHTIGLIAQEVYNVIPEMVSKPDDENQLWGVDYNKIIPVLVKAIQEQQQMIDELKKKNEELNKLKEIVSKLEQNINLLNEKK
jgi:hypothetical protein